MGKLYVAYGSNLNLSQMKHRCPNAEFIGVGEIENYELQFKGTEYNAHATIAPCNGKNVPVGVFDIKPRDEMHLDRYEGYPSYYFKDDIQVKLNSGKKVNAMVYIMDLEQNFGMPSGYYFDTDVLYDAFDKNVERYENQADESFNIGEMSL